jgi:prepilin-type processing-associated H-X9-DG protein
VHPRHDSKAVVAFLDGSVRKMGINELRDMRLWSRNAAIADDPNYTAGN